MSKIRGAILGLMALLLLLGAGTVLAGSSTNYAINWQVLDGGGNLTKSTNGNVIMTDSLGQPAIGPASSSNYELGSGYKYGIELSEEPTAITLVSFSAHSTDEGVIVAWDTGTEIDNAGFNLYWATSAAGPYVKVNDVLIVAKGDPMAVATGRSVATTHPVAGRTTTPDNKLPGVGQCGGCAL